MVARVDRLLTHTVALAGLTALILGIYVIVVLGLGRTPVGGERTLLLLSMVAAGLAALLYLPARRWLTERANRLVYGARVAPDETLRTFGQRLTRSIPLDELMLQLAENLRSSMVLVSAEVWTGQDGTYERTAGVPHRQPGPITIGPKELPVVARAGVSGGTWLDIWVPQLVGPSGSAAMRVAPVAHAGLLLGFIVVTRRPDGEPFTETEDTVLTEIARQIGLALHNVQLDTALQASLDELKLRNKELQDSRARIVAAGDAERRKLERNLHDGAQQHLVALAVKLRLAHDAVEDDPEDAMGMIDEIKADVQTAIAELRALAHGIFPPLLVSGGLAEALPAAAGRAALPTTLELDNVSRYGNDIEAAVYFCTLEALQNAGKHAGETATATVRVDRGRRHPALRDHRRRRRIRDARRHCPARPRLHQHGRPSRCLRWEGDRGLRAGAGHHDHRHDPAPRSKVDRPAPAGLKPSCTPSGTGCGSAFAERVGSSAAMTIMVGLAVGITLTLAAGAHRTATAPSRYSSDSQLGSDALVTQQNAGRPRTEEIAAIGGVDGAESYTFVFGGLIDPVTGELVDSLLFSGSRGAFGAKLVDGRDVDPLDNSEFVASQSFIEATGASIGDRYRLVTLTPQQAFESGFDVDDPRGPESTVTLVGVFDSPGRLDDPSPVALVSPALLDDPDVGIALTMIAVDLAADADVSTLRTELDLLDGSESLSLDEGDQVVSDTVRRAVATQARGLWLLAITTGVAGMIVVGQVVSRQVRPSRDERNGLAAIGFTSPQTNAEAFATGLVPIVLGAVIGIVMAIAVSGSFPVGFVRVVEPHPGVAADWMVLLSVAAIFVTGAATWTLATVVMTRQPGSIAPSSAVESIAARVTATVATGLRMAFVRRANERASARGAVIGITAIVAGVAASMTFGASLDRLIDEPFRFGRNFDALVGDQGAQAIPDGLVETLNERAEVSDLIVYAGTTARAADITTPVIGFDAVRGGGTPYVSGGRLPTADDEIAFGRATAEDLEVSIGDSITLEGPTASADFAVTGLVVMPSLGSTDGMGTGALVTTDGLATIDREARPTGAAINVNGDLAAFFRTALAEVAPGEVPEGFVPAAIHNLDRIDAIPLILGGVLAVLGSISVAMVLVSSTRSRARRSGRPPVARSGRGVGGTGRALAGHPVRPAVRGDRHAARDHRRPPDLHGVRPQHGSGRGARASRAGAAPRHGGFHRRRQRGGGGPCPACPPNAPGHAASRRLADRVAVSDRAIRPLAARRGRRRLPTVVGSPSVRARPCSRTRRLRSSWRPAAGRRACRSTRGSPWLPDSTE